MARFFKWLFRGLLAVAVLVVAGVGGIALYSRGAVPALDGTVRVAGSTGTIEIVRDANGVAHVEAQSRSDAYFGLGYVHAQERLWQMDLLRRLGRGQIAEIAGGRALPADVATRTLGIGRLADQSLARLKPETRLALEAYARGVNAFLDTRDGPLPLEFNLGFYAPRPWTPGDSLVLGKLLGLLLTGNWSSELRRAALVDRLGVEGAEFLMPTAPDGGPPILRETASADGPVNKATPDTPPRWPHGLAETLVTALPDYFLSSPIGASNAWAVTGARTDGRGPILAADPHLGMTAPGIWYLARVSAPGLEAVGGTMPGVPFHLVGHNGHVAWGLTTTYSDTSDLFLEQTLPGDSGLVQRAGGPVPFESRVETIDVRFGAPERITVRRTDRGPIVSDMLAGLGRDVPTDALLSLAHPALAEDDRSADSLAAIQTARSAAEFRAALRDWGAPMQTIVYADTGGDIGVIAPGKLPIRRSGRGLLPAPGHDGSHDWLGHVRFEALPQTENPREGFLVAANNRLVGPDYPYFVGVDYQASHRYIRATHLLRQDTAHTVDKSIAMQLDTVSLLARRLVPQLSAGVRQASGPAAEAAALVAAWDGSMDVDKPQPLIFHAWLRALTARLFADELGPLFGDAWDGDPRVVGDVLARAGGWCNDVVTPTLETCAQQIQLALEDAVAELTEAYGADPSAWRWGDAHIVRFRHPILGLVPGIGGLTTREAAAPGGPETLNRGGLSGSDNRPYAMVHGAGLRFVVDLGDLDNSRFSAAPGQSGDVNSPRFLDMVDDWVAGTYFPIPRTQTEAAAGAQGRMVLLPGG